MATAAVQATSPAWKPQNDGRPTTVPPVSWRELLSLLSPTGQEQIVGAIQRARPKHGADWLEAIKSEFPEFSWLAELICGHDFDEVFELLQNEFSTLPLSMIKPQLENLHATLRFEIERKG